MRYITRTIWILSLISLLTDVASEMLYPILPIYLKSIGFTVVFIGILEGVAEATAGLSKGYFGKRSDVSGRRVPFVQAGYALSAISKPMMALFIQPVWVFFSRTLDRLGKGLRTGARDALLSDESTPATKGKVFGFHRSMDTMGAVLGPMLALVYLHFFKAQYRTLFLIAFLPGLLAVTLSGFLKKKEQPTIKTKAKVSFFAFMHYWNEGPAVYRKLLTGLLIFTLFNSSDVFLLLKGKQAGLGDETVIWIYIVYNLIYAIFAFPAGIIADLIGLKSVFIIGLLLFVVVYAGMSMPIHLLVYFGLYSLYGIYAAATEGISKAWISNVVEKKDTATAIGTYSGFQSICALLANALTGFIWFRFGQAAAFITIASVILLLVFYFLFFIPGINNSDTGMKQAVN